ncbi:MAG: MFS transporter, partial [Hyphomicrobiales bacterium]
MSPSADPRTSLQLMFRGEFAVAFWGKLLLQTGIWAQLMVCVILAFDRTGSAAWVGAVGAAQMVPQLGLALVSGSMSDRYGPAKPISAGGLIVGLGCLGLAGWLNSSLTSSGSAVPILVSSIVIGVGIALSASALQTVPPLLARPNELSAAVGLNFIPTTLARTAGPVVGSLSTATLGYPTTLLIVSATSTLTAAGFLRLRGLRGPTVGKGDHRGIGTVMRYVWADGRLLGLLGGVAAIGAASEAPITLAPAMAAHLEMHGVGVGWIT